MISNTFNFEGKTHFDFPLVEAKKFVTTKVDGQTRADTLFLEEMKQHQSSIEADLIRIELSLCGENVMFDDIEETKLYSNRDAESRLSKHSKVAILRAFMLHKQMNWLRTVMQDTFEDNIQNWCLPLNHTIANALSRTEYANTSRACQRLGGPFDPAKLTQLIGGNVHLYNN